MFYSESPGECLRMMVFRVAAGHSMKVRLLSCDWLRLDLHFAGHSVLCAGPDECRLCELLPARPSYFLPALCLVTSTVGLLELSTGASRDLEQKVRFSTGTFQPGVVVEARRRTKRSGLRFESDESFTPFADYEHRLWWSATFAIFGLPAIRPGESIGDFTHRVHSKVIARADVAAARLKAAPRKGCEMPA